MGAGEWRGHHERKRGEIHQDDRGRTKLAGPAGRRHVAAKDFFVDIMTTALDPGEVLVAIHIPRPNPAAQFRYRKIRHPASGYAVVGVAVALCLHDGIVSEATIGITGATGRAFAADAASAHLIGKPLKSENIATAALLASEPAECLSDAYASADYRKQASRQDRGHPGVGVAKWCLIGQAPPLFVTGRSRSIPRPSKNRACGVQQTP